MTPLTHEQFTRRVFQALLGGMVDQGRDTDIETMRQAQICCESLVVAAENGLLADLADVCVLFIETKTAEVERELGALQAGAPQPGEVTK